MDFIKKFTIRKFWILKLIWNWKGSYFDKSGWVRSFKNKKPVNSNGEAIPWLSYSAYKFLEGRLSSDVTIFEYGAGYSSIYFSGVLKNVISVEHDKNWYDDLKRRNIPNHTLVFKDVFSDKLSYCGAIDEFEEDFEIVLIDGRERNLCAEFAVKSLAKNGVVIFDDFDRDKYSKSGKLFDEHGYKRIDFWGMAVGSIRLKNTAVFYRENNVLGL